jgi:hypothetical protein
MNTKEVIVSIVGVFLTGLLGSAATFQSLRNNYLIRRLVLS